MDGRVTWEFRLFIKTTWFVNRKLSVSRVQPDKGVQIGRFELELACKESEEIGDFATGLEIAGRMTGL